MLNEYWGAIVPEVLGRLDGLIERFSGDAIMVMFNATGEQPDHAVRAARAALALQTAGSALATQHPDWPRFRVGVNTGLAVVGNVGTADQRSFAAIGDATNLAARLQAAAAPGEIVIGETTRLALLGSAKLEPLEPTHVKGKRDAVIAHRLVAIGSSGEAHRLVAIGSAGEARRQSLAMGALGRNDPALTAQLRRGSPPAEMDE